MAATLEIGWQLSASSVCGGSRRIGISIEAAGNTALGPGGDALLSSCGSAIRLGVAETWRLQSEAAHQPAAAAARPGGAGEKHYARRMRRETASKTKGRPAQKQKKYILFSYPGVRR